MFVLLCDRLSVFVVGVLFDACICLHMHASRVFVGDPLGVFVCLSFDACITHVCLFWCPLCCWSIIIIIAWWLVIIVLFMYSCVVFVVVTFFVVVYVCRGLLGIHCAVFVCVVCFDRLRLCVCCVVLFCFIVVGFHPAPVCLSLLLLLLLLLLLAFIHCACSSTSFDALFFWLFDCVPCLLCFLMHFVVCCIACLYCFVVV